MKMTDYFLLMSAVYMAPHLDKKLCFVMGLVYFAAASFSLWGIA